MEGPPVGSGGEDITWPDQVAPRGQKASSTRKIKPQTSNLLRKHQLFPCIDKSTFFQSRVPFCGYIIDKDGVHMDPEKIKVIRGWPPPITVHEVRQFIGMCGFYQQFVEGFQAVAAPLTAMFKSDFECEWTAVHHASFDKLKQAMINATHLSAIHPR